MQGLPEPLDFRTSLASHWALISRVGDQLQLTGNLLQALLPLTPRFLRKCITELGQAVRGWHSLPVAAAVKAMGPTILALRPTLRALGLSSHSSRLTGHVPTEPSEAAKQLYRIVTLLQTAAIRPRIKTSAPATFIWVDDKIGANTAEIEYIASRGQRPLQCTTTNKACELARSAGEENLGFITNSFRKDDGRERTVHELLKAIRGEELRSTPVLVYMGTDPAPFYLPLQAKEPLLIATMDASVLRYFADSSFPLYDAEQHTDTIDGVVLTGGAKPRPVQLVLTTFRLLFLDSPPFTNSPPWALLIEVPLGVVYKVEETLEKESGKVHMKLYCRDFRTVSYTLPKKHMKMSKALATYNADGTLSCLAAQHELEFEDSNSYLASGWLLHSQGWDYERMSLRDNWTELTQKDYDICATYPEIVVLPKGLSSADINALRKNRLFGAVPVLSYFLARSGAALLRAASESSDIADLSRGDTSALERYLTLMGPRPVQILDVGSSGRNGRSFASLPNVARQFVELSSTPDISTVMRKLLLLRKTMLTQDWAESISQVGYLDLVQRTLHTAHSIATLITAGTSVIVQSEDGADVCSLLVSLAALMLDPHYRTISGFPFLVEREWLLHGTTVGWKRKRAKWQDELKLCAPFVLFVDCVWQLWNHDPTAFQFNEEYLRYLLTNLYAGRFGTFLISSEYERTAKHKLPRRTFSIWQETTCLQSLFENPYFDPRGEAYFITNPRQHATLWHAYFLRHLDHQLLHDTAQRLQFMPKQEETPQPQLKIEGLCYLPEDMFELVPFSPVCLNLANCFLSHLPVSLAKQTQLRRLLLTKNRFTTLPLGAMQVLAQRLNSLTELDLADNDLRYIHLDGFPSLRTLRLQGNRLIELPGALSKMTELASLNVSRNMLAFLPERLPLSLTIVEADHNMLPELPMDFNAKSNLRILRLNNNEISYLGPETFQSMSRLCILTLAHTNLGNQARQFRSTHQEDRKLSSIARQMTRSFATAKPALLHRTAMPSSSSSSSSLTPPPTFDVELCLPSSLSTCPLAELDISHLAFPFVPSRVFLLTALVELHLHHNRLASLPTDMSRLERLLVLDVSHNAITYIPLEIASCSALECLNLAHNQLKELTPVVGKLQNLTMLDISANPLRELPPSVGQLTRLKSLLIEGVELDNVPKEIYQAGDSSAVRGFLLDISKGCEPMWRVKLMVAGQENVGKTSLLKCLTRKKKHDGMATDGIHLDTWNIDVSPDDAARFIRTPLKGGAKPPTTVTVSTWDFAGQDTYYASHQFFLSDRSIYLLVWNLAKPESEQRLPFWLQTITSRCPRSPIILVATHLDDKACTEEYVAKALDAVDKRLRPLARQLRVVRAVSCESGKGMEDLREEIESLIFQLDKIGEPVPSAYVALERFALEERKACGVLDASGIAAATSLLNNLGSICHYAQPQLRDVVVLDPQWLVDVISGLFSIKHSFARNGMLPTSALAQIWRESRFPPSLHPYLVQLLERFELVFRLQVEGIDPQLLVPDLLTDHRPNTFGFVWPHTWHSDPSNRSRIAERPLRHHVMGRRYELVYAPRGLFGRFMVRLLRFTKHLCLWQSGLVVESDCERLFALLTGDQIELFVAVSKRMTTSRLTLLQQATEVLTSMLRNWYAVDYKAYVLCACCLGRFHVGKAVFSFAISQITDAIVSGHSVIECREGTSVRIDQMAPELLFNNTTTLDVNELTVGPKIGEGSYAVVHLGNYRGQKVAVKRMRILGALTETSPPASPRKSEEEAAREQLAVFDDFRRELAMLGGLSHPNLLRLVGYFLKPLCIVTEYMNAGDLWALARNTAIDLPWTSRMLLAMHVCLGVAYLHGITPPILHRDLKSPNILLQRDEANRVTAKLADLGLATALTSKTALGRVVDNPVWLAPEVLAGQEYAEAADIYSVAVILWELAARNDFLHEVPFWNAKEQHVMNGGRSEIPADTPPALREAITLCWANEPAQRASMSATAQLLARALPPDAACVLPAQTPQLPGSLPLPQDSGPPGSSVLDSSTSNSPHEGASSLSVTDDDRPPQSASRDLLAVTLVSPRLRCLEPDWMPPVLPQGRISERGPARVARPPARGLSPGHSTRGEPVTRVTREEEPHL